MTESPVWHIVTPEYPPSIGGVADYSRAFECELASQGERVEVWCPGRPPLEEGFSPRGLAALSRILRAKRRPRRLFVQWVPHGYGYRAMNLPFCFWLLAQARAGEHIDLMVHEPFLMFDEGNLRQKAVATVHRVMISAALASAARLWIAIPGWEERLRPWLFGRRVTMEWLPVPSNIPVIEQAPEDLAQLFGNRNLVMGHFGTYGSHTVALLRELLPGILAQSDVNVLLLGRDSDKVAQGFSSPRVIGHGVQAAAELSRSIAACALFLQPYIDGVSSRRSSAMAALAHAKPLVTTTGLPTEAVWERYGAAMLQPATAPQGLIGHTLRLLSDPDARAVFGRQALSLYQDYFALSANVRRLRLSTPMRVR